LLKKSEKWEQILTKGCKVDKDVKWRTILNFYANQNIIWGQIILAFSSIIPTLIEQQVDYRMHNRVDFTALLG